MFSSVIAVASQASTTTQKFGCYRGVRSCSGCGTGCFSGCDCDRSLVYRPGSGSGCFSDCRFAWVRCRAADKTAQNGAAAVSEKRGARTMPSLPRPTHCGAPLAEVAAARCERGRSLRWLCEGRKGPESRPSINGGASSGSVFACPAIWRSSPRVWAPSRHKKGGVLWRDVAEIAGAKSPAWRRATEFRQRGRVWRPFFGDN